MVTLRLDDRPAEVLAFILDVTVDEWTDQTEGQITIITRDPSLKSVEDVLETSGALVDLLNDARHVRAELIRAIREGD